jgi:hypothetical protein
LRVESERESKMAEKSGDYVVMDAVPTATAVPVPATLSVIAPSNLAEGYMLDTEVNGQTVKVQVVCNRKVCRATE